jgi:hypothetical protein
MPSAAVSEFGNVDKRVRDYLKADESLMASDIVFSEGTAAASRAAVQVEAARLAEHRRLMPTRPRFAVSRPMHRRRCRAERLDPRHSRPGAWSQRPGAAGGFDGVERLGVRDEDELPAAPGRRLTRPDRADSSRANRREECSDQSRAFCACV